jgi:hypothetical protein
MSDSVQDTASHNPTPLALGNPLDLDDGRKAASVLARQCRAGVEELDRAVRAHAEAEHAYRKALASKLLELRGQAVPATLALDLAKGQAGEEGDSGVSRLRFERDLAKGMIEVARQRLRQLDGERASLRQLLEWSQRFEERSFTPPPNVNRQTGEVLS